MSKVLVYGYGESGRGAVELLLHHNMEVAVYSDSKIDNLIAGIEDRSNFSKIALLEKIDTLVLSPSVRLDNNIVSEALKKGIEVIGEIELGFRNFVGDTIAVTGTNGKTTTVEMITELLKKAYLKAYALGNIGKSFCAKACKMKEDEIAVLECSSFQLESVNTFKPKIAVLTNLADDHIERHGSFENYKESKLNIFKMQDENDYALLNFDDDIVASIGESLHSKVFYFSTKRAVRGVYLCANGVYFKNDGIEFICSTDELGVKEEHNIRNALVAILIGKILNFPNSIIIKAISEYNILPHRMQLVKIINDVKYINDSKATNMHATLCACKCVSGKTALILGGYDKGYDYDEFFEKLPIKINCIIVYGENQSKIVKSANKYLSLCIIKVENLCEAVSVASKLNVKNVLFSPSTSSYDQFKNYEERGNYFIDCVKGL